MGSNLSFAQNVSVNSTVLTTGLTAAPLVGGSTGNAIFGFTLDKATGGANEVTQLVISVNNDPTTTLVSATLHSSADSDWDGTEPVISNGTLNDNAATPANSIVFTPIGPATNLAVNLNTGGAATENFFVVVTVRNDVNTSPTTPAITLSLTGSGVTATGAVTGSTTSNPSYSFEALETQIAQATGGLGASITAGNTESAIIGFSAVTNGIQSLDDVVFTLTVDPTSGPLSAFKLVNNGNNATYSGGGTILGTVPALTATTVTFNNINQSITATPTYFFLIADVDGAASGSFTTTLTSTTADAGTTTGDGFSRGPTSIVALNATLGLLTSGVAASPLEAGATDQAVLGFSLTSNGAQTVSEIIIETANNPSAALSNFTLIRSTDNNFSTAGDNATAVPAGDIVVSGSGPYIITITPGTPLDISASSATNFFLTADVSPSVVTSPAVQFTLATADITLAPIAITNNSIASASYLFTTSQSTVLSVGYDGQSSIDFTEYNKQTTSGLTDLNSERIFGLTITDADNDTHATTITELVFEISNAANLAAIALFDGTTKLPGTENTVASVIDGSNRITFSGLNIVVGDEAAKTIDIRVTFAPTVIDNEHIDVSVFSATAANTGSGLATLGTLESGASENDINVVSTKLLFNTLPNQEVPNVNFIAIVWATDANNNIDRDATDQVSIAETGPGLGNLAGGGLRSPVNGVYTFNTLSIDLAGIYNLIAADAGGGQTLADALDLITITSLGVQISDGIGPNPLVLDVCYNGNFQPLGTILIKESDPADFASGGIFMLQLPEGFIFDTSVNPTLSEGGSEITFNPLASYFIGNNVVRISYSVSGTTSLDTISIASLQVRYPLSTATPGGEILVLDGSAVQVGNSEADAKSHGTLTATETPSVGYTFEVSSFPGQSNILPEETRFSFSIPGVILKPAASNDPTTNNVFSGNGVSYSATQGAYVFSPASVGVGGSYEVTFTGLNASGCQISVKKTFQVYANSITGLLPEYCINDNTVQSLSVDPSRYDISLYYPEWSALQLYNPGWRVKYNNEAYQCIAASIGIVPTNPLNWKKVGYSFAGDYAISLPTYKNISSVTNNGAGLITVTSPNHGFSNGANLYLQYYVYDPLFTTIIFFVPYNLYTISNVTANTFTINFVEPNAGTFNTGYGGIYLQNPPVTNVAVAGTTLTITINNHGVSNGSKVQVYLSGLSNNGVSTIIYDWFTVTNATANTFDIVSPTPVSGTWSGYGFVDVFTYRVSSFAPSMVTTLNTNITSVTEIYVGFMVNQIGCELSSGNTCNSLIYTYEPVKINQLAQLDFTGLNAAGTYCAAGPAIPLQGNQTDGAFMGGGVTDGGANVNTASFDPKSLSITRGVPFLITYEFTDSKNCSASISKQVIVNETPVPPTPAQDEFGYCQNDTQALVLKATGNPGADFAWYNTPAKTVLLGTGPVYDASSVGTASPVTQSFYVTQFSSGCESDTRQVDLVINPLPSADFTNLGQCAKDSVTFVGPTQDINSWHWDFGDGNTSIETNPKNYFEDSRTYSIRLDVTSVPLIGGAVCRNSVVENLFIGDNPKIKFAYNRICDGDQTQFVHESVPDLDSIRWDFGDGVVIKGKVNNTITAPQTSGQYKSPVHQFPNQGRYTVQVIGKTSIGCADTVSRVVPILIKLNPTPADPYLMLTADPLSESGFWLPESTVDSTMTWEFDTPKGIVLNKSDSVWITNAVGAYKANDLSYVNSPCFDLTAFDRPLISLDFINDTQFSRDGVVLEYSLNSGLTWIRLGNPATGLSWYTPTPVNALGNVFGWSQAGIRDFQTAAHSLSDLADKSQVRFRIKFASDQDTEGEGFAFRNVKIIEKNRKVLIENFTNSSATSTINHNTVFRELHTYISETEYVPLEYHFIPAGFGSDPIHSQNKVDNNARAAFYGLTQTINAVQDGLLMGNFNANNTAAISQSFSDEFNLRSLKASEVSLAINTMITADNELQVDATITALEEIPDNGENYAIYIALVEKTILNDPDLNGTNGESEFKYVLRKFLPHAAGTALQLPMAASEAITVSEVISISNNMFSAPGEMGVVVFIQDQNVAPTGRKEVLQAEINIAPVLPPVITGSETFFNSQIQIYPNPAREILNIKLAERSRTFIPLELIDNFGKAILTDGFKPGEQSKSLSTGELANGVYVLKIQNEKGEVAIRKIVITHSN